MSSGDCEYIFKYFLYILYIKFYILNILYIYKYIFKEVSGTNNTFKNLAFRIAFKQNTGAVKQSYVIFSVLWKMVPTEELAVW